MTSNAQSAQPAPIQVWRRPYRDREDLDVLTAEWAEGEVSLEQRVLFQAVWGLGAVMSASLRKMRAVTVVPKHTSTERFRHALATAFKRSVTEVAHAPQ